MLFSGVLDGNPFSEAQIKTMKYRVGWPGKHFDDISAGQDRRSAERSSP